MAFTNIVTIALLAGAALSGCAGLPQGGQETGASYPLNHPAQRNSWMFGHIRGEMIETSNYQLYTTIMDRDLIHKMPGFLEACHANYSTLTGLPASAGRAGDQQKLPVYLMSTHKQWKAVTERITGPHADIFLQITAGGYCYDGICVFWDIGALPTYTVAAHEGMHQFLHHATRQSLPAWAEEGLAVLAEGLDLQSTSVNFRPDQNILRFTDLRNAIAGGRMMNVEELVATDAATNVQKAFTGPEYYAQLWALLLLIQSDAEYRSGLQRMLQDAAEGRMATAMGIPAAGYNDLRRNARLYNQVIGQRTLSHYIDADSQRLQRRFEQFSRELARL